ncbi:MAG: PadR family transcriptional regulator [Terriglobia bacterium]
MSTRRENERLELLQGTLDLLILRTLIFGPQHGQGIGHAIQQTTEDELLVEHGALYPALQRLEERGWIAAEWGTSTNNRKARFYTLTPGCATETTQARVPVSRWLAQTLFLGVCDFPKRLVGV